MTTKKQREQAEALDCIRDALASCGPAGSSTLLIHDDGGRPSSTGRTHHLTVQVIGQDETTIAVRARPRISLWLTNNVATACGYRLSRNDTIVMGGYGYSRSYQIASHLAKLAGHPLYCQTAGATFGGPDGWVKP